LGREGEDEGGVVNRGDERIGGVDTIDTSIGDKVRPG